MKNLFFLLILFMISGTVLADTSIWDVSVFFCTTWHNSVVKNSTFFIQAGKKYPICLRFANDATGSAVVDFSFVQWTFTDDSLHTKACWVQTGFFSQLIQFPISRLELSPQSKTLLTWTLEFPLGFSGRVHGCIVYNLVKPKLPKAMFTIITRRANFFDGYVISDFKRNSSVDDSWFIYQFTWGKLILSLPLINSWTIDEIALISWSLYNTLWYQRSVSGQQLVSYGSSVVFQQVFDDIPFYKSMYFFSGNVSFSPDLNFDIVELPFSLYKVVHQSFFYRVFLMPWGIIYCLLGFVVVVLLVQRIRK